MPEADGYRVESSIRPGHYNYFGDLRNARKQSEFSGKPVEPLYCHPPKRKLWQHDIALETFGGAVTGIVLSVIIAAIVMAAS